MTQKAFFCTVLVMREAAYSYYSAASETGASRANGTIADLLQSSCLCCLQVALTTRLFELSCTIEDFGSSFSTKHAELINFASLIEQARHIDLALPAAAVALCKLVRSLSRFSVDLDAVELYESLFTRTGLPAAVLFVIQRWSTDSNRDASVVSEGCRAIYCLAKRQSSAISAAILSVSGAVDTLRAARSSGLDTDDYSGNALEQLGSL